ncbi:metallophosphoesterase family protein [Pectinatus sottacetonis]|uniref:metallophosphoesterase family protein n=1 Tax=Pectinatus sottacetonis TaxID=1002795 RepID=UPI001E525A34|nr:YfcE family phosphodiesterase [Pectinatus sottacetonis]
MSDSHGNIKPIEKAVNAAGVIDIWLHAGDYIQDAEYLQELTGRRVIRVAGNGDWNCLDSKEDVYFTIKNKNVWLTHGHKYKVKWGIETLREESIKNKADIIIFGHSHIYMEKKLANQVFLNPGSISLPRDGKCGTFAVINFPENKSFFYITKYTIR